MTFSIERTDPNQIDIVRMIAESDLYYASLYPADSNHLLDMETLCAPSVSFFVVRDQGAVLGFGAVVACGGYGEVKRMYVDPAARGRKIGRLLLEAIERRGRELGLGFLRLETGIRQPEAISLYRSHGFRDIDPFGGYAPDPLSLFMEKRLE